MWLPSWTVQGGTAWLWWAVLVGWAGLGRRQAGVHGGGSRALHCPGPQAGGRPWSTCVPLPASSCGSFPASSAAPTSTSCRMMTGRPSRPGSTASASVGSSWCPPCSTLSPGRRATSGTCCPVHGTGASWAGDQGWGPRWAEGGRVWSLPWGCRLTSWSTCYLALG